jgi:hypothetical protein
VRVPQMNTNIRIYYSFFQVDTKGCEGQIKVETLSAPRAQSEMLRAIPVFGADSQCEKLILSIRHKVDAAPRVSFLAFSFFNEGCLCLKRLRVCPIENSYMLPFVCW